MILTMIKLPFFVQKNEIAQITLKSEYGFGKSGNSDKGIGPDTPLTYEVKLNTFEKAKESWQLDADAKLEQVFTNLRPENNISFFLLGQNFQR